MSALGQKLPSDRSIELSAFPTKQIYRSRSVQIVVGGRICRPLTTTDTKETHSQGSNNPGCGPPQPSRTSLRLVRSRRSFFVGRRRGTEPALPPQRRRNDHVFDRDGLQCGL